MNPIRFPTSPVLLVDYEEEFTMSMRLALFSDGINHVVQCQDSSEVMSILSKMRFSVVVLDLLMPGLSGLDLLQMILAEFPELPVMIVTEMNNADTAVECMKNGVFDYLIKPVDSSCLVTTIRRGIEISDSRHQNRQLSGSLENPEVFSDIITQDHTMHSIFQYVETIARTALPVLITGETGVGKEMIAVAIHSLSGRKGKFVPINIAGLDDHLLSDTLFGHRRGAFTGADLPRKGMIEQSSDGTIFLDEIGDLYVESQVKLLRLLQQGTYYPLGDDTSSTCNARTIVATNREIQFLRNSETFRTDLYFRLKPHHIHLPPLRERLGDIPLLVAYFLESAAETMGKKTPTAPQELFDLLGTYSFPGNVRELEGMVANAVSRHKGGVLSTATFHQEIDEQLIVSHEDMTLQASKFADELSVLPILPDLKEALKEAEQLIISEALKRANGNQTTAAQLLGISRHALNKRLNRARTLSDAE